MKRQSSVLRTWLIQGAIGGALVAAWLLVRDPTSVVAYPIACASPTPATLDDACPRPQTLDREYFRIDPARGHVTTWEDRPMARAESLTNCRFEDLGNWSCATTQPGVRVGLRDEHPFREIDGAPDPSRRYSGFLAWWWTWLGEVVTGRTGAS